MTGITPTRPPDELTYWQTELTRETRSDDEWLLILPRPTSTRSLSNSPPSPGRKGGGVALRSRSDISSLHPVIDKSSRSEPRYQIPAHVQPASSRRCHFSDKLSHFTTVVEGGIWGFGNVVSSVSLTARKSPPADLTADESSARSGGLRIEMLFSKRRREFDDDGPFVCLSWPRFPVSPPDLHGWDVLLTTNSDPKGSHQGCEVTKRRPLIFSDSHFLPRRTVDRVNRRGRTKFRNFKRL